jgi:hypothetical protein
MAGITKDAKESVTVIEVAVMEDVTEPTADINENTTPSATTWRPTISTRSKT